MVRAMTWNLWWRFGPWWRRQPAIAQVLDQVAPDIVGLQEVWVEEEGANQAHVLGNRLGYDVAVGPLRFHDGLAFTNAILSRWPIRTSEATALPAAADRPSYRHLLRAEVDAPSGPLAFFTTHLDWRFDASAIRVAQVRAVAELIAKFRPEPETSFPAVLAGDFNAVPHADEIRLLTGATAPPVDGLVFTDAWAVAGDGPGHTFSGHNPHLVDAAWPNRRIDYVMISWPRPKPIGSVARCYVAGTEPVQGVVPSDHYAVVAELRTG